MNNRVIIFGLDGASYTVLDHLIAEGVMPFLGKTLGTSARGILQSSIPVLTPPAWTSLVTGRTPGTHGIFNFLQYESPNSSYVRMITSREVKAESLWSMVNRHGKRAGCLNFVAHSPPPKIDGYVIPGWLSWRWIKRQSHPTGLIERLSGALAGFDIKELAMNFSEEEKAISGTFEQEYEPWIDLHIRRELQWFNILKYQLINDPTELTAVVFDGVDKLQHLCWRFLDPTRAPADPTESFIRVRNRCWDYFRQIDRFLQEIVQLAGSDTHILICSDHGFTGTEEVLYINSWLEQQGYLAWAADAPFEDDDSRELGGMRPYHRKCYDMSKTRAYGAFASNNGIYIPVRGKNGDQGLEPEAYDSVREEIKQALLTRCVDLSGRPLVTQVLTREEAFSGPMSELAPDLTLALRDHGNFSVLRSRDVLKARPEVMGCHHPDGVFVAIGPGVKQGHQISPIRLIDIAPTVLYVMGLPIPEVLEGQVAIENFTSEFVAGRDIKFESATADTTLVGVRNDGESDETDVDDPQVMMRLKALGYI